MDDFAHNNKQPQYLNYWPSNKYSCRRKHFNEKVNKMNNVVHN